MAVFASVIVDGGVDYRTEAADDLDGRLHAMCDLVEHLGRTRPTLAAVLFPAGYLCTATVSRVAEVAATACERLGRLDHPFAVVWGIDGWIDGSKQQLACGDEGYPFFAFAKLPGSGQVHAVRQTVIYAEDGRAPGLNNLWAGRSITVPGTSTALLICGECQSTALLDRVRLAGARVLLIPAHQTVNLRDESAGGWANGSWHLILDEFSRSSGIPVVLSEHTRSPGRHPYSWGGRPAGEVELPDALAVRFTVKLTEV